MSEAETQIKYPENVYCAIFGGERFPNLPLDAEETLEYFLGTFSQRDADIFMLQFKDNKTAQEISAELGGISVASVRQNIAKSLRLLRHISRTPILKIGREAYLNSVVVANKDEVRQYRNRIAKLERLVQIQYLEIAELQDKWNDLCISHDVIKMKIEVLNLKARTFNCLTKVGIVTIKGIISYDDLSTIPGLGRASVREVEDKLRELFAKTSG